MKPRLPSKYEVPFLTALMNLSTLNVVNFDDENDAMDALVVWGSEAESRKTCVCDNPACVQQEKWEDKETHVVFKMKYRYKGTNSWRKVSVSLLGVFADPYLLVLVAHRLTWASVAGNDFNACPPSRQGI